MPYVTSAGAAAGSLRQRRGIFRRNIVGAVVILALTQSTAPSRPSAAGPRPEAQIKAIQDALTNLGLVLGSVHDVSLNDTRLGDIYYVPARQPEDLRPGRTQLVVDVSIYPTEAIRHSEFDERYKSYSTDAVNGAYPNKGEEITAAGSTKAMVLAFTWNAMRDTAKLPPDNRVYHWGYAEGIFGCGNVAVSVQMRKAHTVPASETSNSTVVVPALGKEMVEPAKEWVRKVASAFQGPYLCEGSQLPLIFIPGVAGSVLERDSIGPKELWPKAPFRSRVALGIERDGHTPAVAGTKIVAPDIIRGAVFDRWPIVYRSMLAALASSGYKEKENLFLFPYDWRLDNADHVLRLAALVDDVLKETGARKVNILTHSMGGLIGRAYVNSAGAKKVDTLITMVMPLYGAPKAFYAIVNGYTFGNGTIRPELMKVLSQNWPAAYQLTPRVAFIRKQSDRSLLPLTASRTIEYHGYSRVIDWGHDTPLVGMLPFLDVYDETTDTPWYLNKELLATADRFHSMLVDQFTGKEKPLPAGVKHYAIAGRGVRTLTGYSMRPAVADEPYVQIGGARVVLEPLFGDGDGTVPEWSSTAHAVTALYPLVHSDAAPAAHIEIVGSASSQRLIKEILKGGTPPSGGGAGGGTLRDIEPGVDFTLHSDAHLRIERTGKAATGALGPNAEDGIDETIAGGTYLAINGAEYALLSPSTTANTYTVSVNGLRSGKFTLDVLIRRATRPVAYRYAEVPVQKGTMARMTFSPSAVAASLPALDVTTGGTKNSVPAVAVPPASVGTRDWAAADPDLTPDGGPKSRGEAGGPPPAGSERVPPRADVESGPPTTDSEGRSPNGGRADQGSRAPGGSGAGGAGAPVVPGTTSDAAGSGPVLPQLFSSEPGAGWFIGIGVLGLVTLGAGALVWKRRTTVMRSGRRIKVAARLDVRYQDGGTKQVRIIGARTTIGRRADNACQINDEQASAVHAEIIAGPAGFVLRDLSSSNGTLLNGGPVTESPLYRGDAITIGTTTIVLEHLDH